MFFHQLVLWLTPLLSQISAQMSPSQRGFSLPLCIKRHHPCFLPMSLYLELWAEFVPLKFICWSPNSFPLWWYLQVRPLGVIRSWGFHYRYPAYLTFMPSTSCEMLGWMKHKLESSLLGRNINNQRYAGDTALTAEIEAELKSLLMKM